MISRSEEMKVEEVLTRTSLRFDENDRVVAIANYLLNKRIRGGLVVNDMGDLVGAFSDTEIFMAAQQGKEQLRELFLAYFKILNEYDDILRLDFGTYACNPVQNDSGTIIGYLPREVYLEAYAKASQMKLKHYDAIFNSAHNGILSIDSSGRITSINPKATQMAKTTKEQAIGKVLTDVVLPTGLLDVVRTGKKHTEKYQAGSRKYITNRSPIMEGNEVVGAVGVFQDISEIEFISNELESVKQIVNELDTVINTSTNGICVIDEHHQVTRMNRQFKKMFRIQAKPNQHSELPKYIVDFINKIFAKKKADSILQKDQQTNNSLIISGTPVF